MKKSSMILLCVLLCLFTMSSGIFAADDVTFAFQAGSSASAAQFETVAEGNTITVKVPDNVSQFAAKVTLPENSSATIEVGYTNTSNKATTSKLTSGTAKSLSGFIKADGNNNTATITITEGEKTTVYTLKTTRVLTFASLAAKGYTISPAFSVNTKEYDITIPADLKTISLVAVAKSADAVFSYNGNSSSKVDIAGKDQINIEVSQEGNISSTCTVNLKRVETKTITVTAQSPEKAIVTIYDKSSNNQLARGIGSATTDKAYDDVLYTVTQNGYVGKSGQVAYADINADPIVVTLEKAAANSKIDSSITAEWGNFRNSDVNMAITSAALPYETIETLELWSNNYDGTYANNHPMAQLIVDDALVVIQDTRIFKVDKATGEILVEGTMVKNGGLVSVPTSVYAEGMIICSLTGGTIQAFDAKTLESLWVYSDPLAGQCQTPLTYSDGYVYTGFWSSELKETNYVCVSVTDEDPAQTNEAKTATWTRTNIGGYYWAGALILGDTIIFGGDNGSNINDYAESTLVSLNKYTGEVISETELIGDQRSSIAYSKEKGRIYFTTKCGYLYSAAVDEATGVISDLKYANGFGNQSTCTPIVYDNTVYFTTGSGISADGSKGGFVALDADTLEKKFDIGLIGYPQGASILSTAYLESEGKLCFYTTYNNNPGGLTLIKVDPTKTGAEAVEKEEIFTPENQQYSTSSLICDDNGTIYYKNDTPLVFAIVLSKGYLNNLTSNVGTWSEEFNKDKINYEVVVPIGTKKVTFTADVPEGMTMELNGEANGNTVTLSEGKATASFVVTSKGSPRTYTVNVREAASDTTLKMAVNGGNNITSASTYIPTEAVTEGNIITVWNPAKYSRVWLAPQSNSTVTEFEILQGSTAEEKYTAKAVEYNGISYVGYYIDTKFTLPIAARATVTAENGKTTDTYYFVAAASEDSVGYASALSFEHQTYVFEEENETLQLNVTRGKQIGTGEPETLTWSSSDPTVATVDENGVVTCVGEGQAVITAAGVLTSASCTVSTNDIKVTFRLIGATIADEAIDFSNEPGEYYGSEYQNWIKTQTYILAEGATVYDVFMEATEEHGLSQTGAENGYVASITAPNALGGYELSEFTNGTYSGWQYTINGTHPRLSVKQYVLENGDEIVFHYSNDFTYEDESSGDHPEYQNKWLEAADVLPTDIVAAAKADEAIAAIGTVTADSKAAIDAAREAFNALTVEQMELLENYDILLAAEKAYSDLTAEIPFSDIPDDWYQDAIRYVYVNEIMNGMTETSFEPGTTLNRAMFITMIWRMQGEPAPSIDEKYSDVPADAWYTAAVSWGTQEGIVEGYNGNFDPDGAITREQMAAMLYRYAAVKGIDVSAASDFAAFSDGNTVSDWAKEEMGWAVAVKLITGYDTGLLEPQGNATRAEAATVITRFAETIMK